MDAYVNESPGLSPGLTQTHVHTAKRARLCLCACACGDGELHDTSQFGFHILSPALPSSDDGIENILHDGSYSLCVKCLLISALCVRDVSEVERKQDGQARSKTEDESCYH